MSRTRDVVMIHELARESNPFAEIVIDGRSGNKSPFEFSEHVSGYGEFPLPNTAYELNYGSQLCVPKRRSGRQKLDNGRLSVNYIR